MSKITIDSQTVITYTGQKSLLECMEENGLPAEYNCRQGFCGVCRTRKLSGEVKYIVDPLAFYDEQEEILPCVCIPTSDIEIGTD